MARNLDFGLGPTGVFIRGVEQGGCVLCSIIEFERCVRDYSSLLAARVEKNSDVF